MEINKIKKKKIVFVMLSIMLLGLAGCSSSFNKTETGNIYGQVYFPEVEVSVLGNNNPGRTVVYLDDKKYQVTTTNGNFTFNNVKAGTHTLQIKDKYYYSKEYKVKVENSSIKTELKDKIGGIYLKSWYLGGGSNLVSILQVNLSSEIAKKIKSGEYKVKVFRIKDGKEILIEAYKNDYWLDGNVYVEDIFNLNKKYKIKVKVFNSKGKVTRQFTKQIIYHKLNLIGPKDSVTKSNPTFNWEEIDGIVTYSFNLSHWDKANSYWSSLFTLNSNNLSIPQYVLQVTENDADKWVTGNKYRWHVKGYLYDKAGHCYEEFQSVKMKFDYK
ncbi:Protein of unknown function (DUF2012) [Halobacteroides halobius DSM 5150]|uniref:ER membrane protein complex subunit 7 beta-sandwich domain-containing protein n=1 Tax=Halobacteroides halobius (strain ATCC 35273 / DSM 5150 / MD-1) TaxID=748449 RepID=L0K873_HALHC|nr:DUF2012 domain-containing protein [Halobacteroides halobius]AGB41482.1 Protein of unknown function (DUF2012) [Halobacteroides halobius DSM 5150]